MLRLLLLAAVLPAGKDGLIRHYLFDEGRGNEVVNHVTLENGKRAVCGGPLGSLEIHGITPYGIDTSDCYTSRETNAVRSGWCEGRVPGKAALRVGTMDVGLFRSGVTGKEFAKGMTVCGWIKFERDGRPHVMSYPLRLGTGVADNGFLLKWTFAPWKPTGFLEFAVGHPKDRDGTTATWVRLEGAEPDVWHSFAASADGREISLTLDGRRAATPYAGAVIPKLGDVTWYGIRPFYGGRAVPCLHVGNVMDPTTPPCPFALDELAIFDRALPAEELKAFFAEKPAAGTWDEQRAASAAERSRREAAERIVLKIPEDSNGYFRLGEKIPVTVSGVPAPGCRLNIRVETTYGRVADERSVALDPQAAKPVFIRPDRCDAYRVCLSVADADGKVVKRPDEPYFVGIVPPAPDHLDSPFGWWATSDGFSYDSNLRRVAFVDGMMSKGRLPKQAFSGYVRRQRIRAEDLRLYAVVRMHRSQQKKMTPSDLKYWTNFWNQVAVQCRENGIREFELDSEVDGVMSPELYVDQMKVLVPILRREVPDAVFYPPGATPCALPYVNKLLELGVWKYAVGVSHHNYLSNPVYNYYWDNPGKRLKEIVDRHSSACGKKLRMFNTESGIFSLPYVHGRPMTREHARSANYSVSQIGGYETYNTSMPILPDDEAAAVQVHAVLVNLASGYEMYVKCQSPARGGALPCRQGVALTALSGQVLNDMTAIRAIPMSSLKTMAVLVDREHKYTKAKSNCLAVFGMEEKPFTFKVAPNATYRTMDLLGNAGTMKADANGVLRIVSRLEPVYVFDVPADVAELTPMRLDLPKELPEDGVMVGKVVLENPFATALAGDLKADPLRGAEIELGQRTVRVAPGGRLEVPFRLKATGLKRRNYPVRVTLGTLVAEAAFASNGLVYVIPRVAKPFALDGDGKKWEGVPEMVCDTEDDVVHGKPNFAELWLPQWQNRADLSLAVRTCYVRDDAVYFRLDVTDQAVRPARGEEIPLAFCFDCLELFVDTRTGKALGAPVDFGADQVIVPAVDSAALGKSPLWYAKRENRHVEVETVGRRTEKGWMLEGRIVPNAKSALRLRPGSRLMMDFVVDDCDGEKQKRKSAMAFHGSLDNNSNVAGWGRYELGL